MASSITSSPPRVKQLESILVKPSGPDCNIACSYCFYLKKADLYPETQRHRMSDAVLEAMIRQVMRDGPDYVSFGWQGGEPTLMGREFFERVVGFQKQYGRPGQSVANAMQTNGLLLDETWVPLFKEYNFLIGLSLDGPREIHDHYRVTRGERPTWEQVVHTARMLVRNGVMVNALAVVSDRSSREPDAIYDFHKSLGLRHMQFIPCVDTLPDNPTLLAPWSVPTDAWGEFLVSIFDRWRGDFRRGRPTTFVRWFESLIFSYAGLEPPDCTLREECGNYVVVEHNGDVYSCDFYVEPAWKLGNVLHDEMLQMLNSPRQGEFGRRKADLPEVCRKCRWLDYCRGGCPIERADSPSGLNRYCGSYMRFFEHANPRFSQDRESRRIGHGAGRPAGLDAGDGTGHTRAPAQHRPDHGRRHGLLRHRLLRRGNRDAEHRQAGRGRRQVPPVLQQRPLLSLARQPVDRPLPAPDRHGQHGAGLEPARLPRQH
jgi:uncharacterized protein